MIHLKKPAIVDGSIGWAKVASFPDVPALRVYLRENNIERDKFSPKVDRYRAYDGARWIGIQVLTQRGAFA